MAPLFTQFDLEAVPANVDLPAIPVSADQLASKVFRSFAGSKMHEIPHDIFRLRYEVYCLECAFLDPGEFHGELEFDEFDVWSHHFAAYSIDETLVGTVRLVQPPSAGHRYPFQQHCRLFDNTELPPREQTAEISRLAVRKTHRRRRSDSLWGVPGVGPGEDEMEAPPAHALRKRESPMLLLGLYREMFRYSRATGVRYWLAAMERSLARSLERMGFRFRPIGPQCDYYGAVTPYMLDLDELYGTLAASNPELAAWFAEPPAGA